MVLALADRVAETSVTSGTGTYSLAGVLSAAWKTFVAGVGDNNDCVYLAEYTDPADGLDWEIGIGTVDDASPDTLARTRILKSSNGDAAVSWSAEQKTITCVPCAAFIRNAAPPLGHLFGLQVSVAADTDHDRTIAVGDATDETGDYSMRLASPITKQIDAAWAVGTNAGGLNTGAVAANTWYEYHLIFRKDTGVVDAMYTTTANRGTLPSGYTHSRRIRWVRTDASANILPDKQYGDIVILDTPINDVAVTATTTETAVTLTVPPNSIALFRAGTTGTTSVNTTNATVFKSTGEGTAAPDDTTGVISIGAADVAAADGGHFQIPANGSSQIKHDSDGTSYTFDISTYGWIDTRGRDAA